MSTKNGFINYLKYKYQATYISSIKSDQDAYVFFFFFSLASLGQQPGSEGNKIALVPFLE